MKNFKVKERRVKLLSFLKEKCPECSVKSLKKAIDENRCLVNGNVIRIATTPLSAGDQVQLNLKTVKKVESIPLLYEEKEFFLCNKPPGIVCTEESLKTFFPKQKLYLVHRLDKDTTGVLLIAKTKQMQEKFIALFRKREVAKTYLAIVDGIVKGKEGKIETYMGKIASLKGQSLWGRVAKHKGLLAITFWKKLKAGKNWTLLACKPVTGRTHQLRVHLSEMGYPILGDYQYGKHFVCNLRPQRHLLHAYQLQFPHPDTGKKIDIEAPIPQEIEELIPANEVRGSG